VELAAPLGGERVSFLRVQTGPRQQAGVDKNKETLHGGKAANLIGVLENQDSDLH
jgi:hypothetical protein